MSRVASVDQSSFVEPAVLGSTSDDTEIPQLVSSLHLDIHIPYFQVSQKHCYLGYFSSQMRAIIV